MPINGLNLDTITIYRNIAHNPTKIQYEIIATLAQSKKYGVIISLAQI